MQKTKHCSKASLVLELLHFQLLALNFNATLKSRDCDFNIHTAIITKSLQTLQDHHGVLRRTIGYQDTKKLYQVLTRALMSYTQLVDGKTTITKCRHATKEASELLEKLY